MVNDRMKSALATLLVVVLFCAGAVSALAASVDATATPEGLLGPGSVDVSVAVRNDGVTPLLDASVMTGEGEYPIGDIYPDDSGSAVVSGYQVNQGQLDDGFRWDLQWWTEEGELQSQSFSVPVAKIEGTPSLSLRVQADKEQYRSGEEATLTYRVTNTGNVPLSDIVILDAIASAPIAQGISLSPGDSESKTHTLTVEKTLESAASASGRAESGREASAEAEGLTLEVPETGLNILLSEVERGAGMTSVDILLVNNGTVDFTGITLTDDAGAVIASDLALKEGEEAHIDYELPLDGARQLTVNARYTAGDMEEALSVDSAPLELAPLYLPENIALTATVRADKTELEEAGSVSLQLTLQNDNPIDLQNVVLKEEMGGTLLSIPVLPQGSSEHTAAVNVLESKDISLYVEYEDTEGRPYREDIPALHVEVPTAETVPSPVPLPEVSDDNMEMLVLMIVLAAVLVAVLVAIVILLVKRTRLSREGDDERLLEEMEWIPQAPRRAVPKEAVRAIPQENANPSLEGKRSEKQPVIRGEERVQPRVLHGKRSEDEVQKERVLPRERPTERPEAIPKRQNERPNAPRRQAPQGQRSQAGRPHEEKKTPPPKQPTQLSAAAERARRESVRAQQGAYRGGDEKMGRVSSTPMRPAVEPSRSESAAVAARRLAEQKQREEARRRKQAAQKPADGRMARKQQSAGNAPEVPNFIIDEQERPRKIQGGAVLVPKEYTETSAPRRARPVEEQLSTEVESPKSLEVDEWTLFEEAFSPEERRRPAELDDWALFEESFLEDDPEDR